MTVDDILARKREVLAQRREAQEKLERGEGDQFDLFMLEEELQDLNAQLRSLRGGPKAQRATSSALSMDRGQYEEWLTADRDEEMHAEHQTYIHAVKNGANVLTARQREIFDLWQEGVPETEIAQRLGIDKSTVSRTLKRAKGRLREEAERLARKLRLQSAAVFDLSDRDVARVILSCLTSHQAVCIYLYYGEWLNLRDCGELLGIDHTAVLRTVQRGLRAIQDTVNCETFALDNADALSDLAYELYVEQGGARDVLPEPAKHHGGWARRKMGRRPGRKRDLRPVPLCVVRTSDGYVSENGKAHQSLMRPMSKLLSLLFELRAKGTLYRWLEKLFQKVTRKRIRGKEHVAVR